ncbi:MAG TPA: pilin [Candidatus Magasanikbacteria bacterium]|nr:pilin [Candidatus Magasanikbacteria bacterium]
MLKKKKLLVGLLFSLTMIFSFAPVVANAQDVPTLKDASDKFTKSGAAYGESPITLETVIGSIVKTALSLIGVIFLVLMIYGGYLWMTARGDSKIAEKAKDIITMAAIGLVIVMLAYAITYFVVANLSSSTGLSVDK